MPEPEAVPFFREAIDRLRLEISALERQPLTHPVGDRLRKARLELGIAEAELAAIQARRARADDRESVGH